MTWRAGLPSSMSDDATRILLLHMLDSSREAHEYVRGLSREDLDGKRQLQHSLIRCIEIVGEAASRIAPAYCRSNPEVPWADIVAMRNRLIHAYFDVDLNLVWSTCKDELPELIRQLQELLDR